MVRRKVLEAVWHINERTDRVAPVVTLAYFASLVASRFYDVNHAVKIFSTASM